MLKNLSNEIKYCLQHAEECRRKAESAPASERDSFLKLERSWMALAESYGLTDRLKSFTRSRKRTEE